ncbi:dicarboxylate/amino acid:cation symporter [Halosquirtibacter laminarini]|uniref:Dicarboxylate/amino acid:cation symporter n=1 Tax=Halosquirtibacter laminarini TaxID=3374600 RepID=A0AC61NNR6_9BACT|nr:dicarboxylate/amino acid:cation symporter [Prolixibacteraceae bacterium]
MNLKVKKIITNLGFQILLAMVVGIGVGAAIGKSASVFAPLGTVFIQLIKMLVVPLVTVSIISGASSLGATKKAGKVGLSTIFYFLLTTAVSVTLGLILGEVFKPGVGLDTDLVKSMFPAKDYTAAAQTPGFWDVLLGMIPQNPIESLVRGNILQIIFFGLFLGIAISTLPSQKKDPVVNGLNYITEALIWMIKIVMYTAPIGVFGLMANATGTFGFDMLEMVLKLVMVNLVGVLLLLFILYPLTLKLFSKISIKQFFTKMTKPQIVAFSTASSMATLPVNMEVCEEELGVSKQTSSFVLPLGATINMTGNALYYALVAVFFAQMFGHTLDTSQYVAIILTATVGSIGQAGVPGPTLLVVAVLAAANIPLEGLPLLYALDRVFDMVRTSVNITGDAACAVIVDKFNR